MGFGFLMFHSGLRYLILVAGIAMVGYALYGQVMGKPYDKRMRLLGSGYAMLMHLQILAGIAMLFGGMFDPRAGVHIITMVFAAASAQIPVSVMRRRPEAERSFGPIAVFGAVSLVLVALGIVALGKPIIG
jgi:uncharacterized membrane protein YphA (DoxX/SURF4 family)